MSTRKRALLVLYTTSFLILFLGGLSIYMNITVFSTKGIELAKLQQERDEWRSKNDAISQEIHIRRSYGFIRDEASKQGFVESDYYYLKLHR